MLAIILDFDERRVWKQGDEGYAERMAAALQLIQSQKTMATGSIPPGRKDS